MILGIDPGKKTGLALINPVSLRSHYSAEVAGGLIDSMFAIEVLLDALDVTVLTVVMESYVITGNTHKKAQELDALWLIGATKWECYKRHIPIHMQSRDIKSWADDKKLEVLGLKFPGDGHARDAARHVLGYMNRYDMFSREQLERIIDGVS